MSYNLFVCTSCGSAHRTKRRVRVSNGERLLEQLQALHQDSSLQADFSIHPVQCMERCNHCGAIALSAPGKHTYRLRA